MNDVILRFVLSFGIPNAIGLLICFGLQETRILADRSIKKIKEHKEKIEND